MARVDVSLPNKNHLVVGISGSGKSSWVKRRVQRVPRLFVWDPDGEYEAARYSTKTEFIEAVKKCYSTSGGTIAHARTIERRFRLALSVDPTPQNFEFFCRTVLTVAHAKFPVTVVAEEIADCTTPQKASVHWGRLCRRGRKYNVQLFAVTQRPSECDKTIYSQSAFKWLGYMDNEADHARLGKLCGLPAEFLAEIPPLKFFFKTPGPVKNYKLQSVRIPNG